MNAKVLIVGFVLLLSEAHGQVIYHRSTSKSRPCDVRGPHYLARTSNGQENPWVVNGNIEPYIPEGHTIKENQKQEPYWPENVKISLSPIHPEVDGDTGEAIRNKALQVALREGKELANATLLDFLFSYPGCVPKKWQDGKAICFLGTVYADSRGDRYVHYIYHDGISLTWGRKCLKERWSESFHIVRLERPEKFELKITKN